MSVKISRWFTRAEVACKCGCGLVPGDEVLALADSLRDEWGGSLICSSGARCAAYTKDLKRRGYKAATGSAHNSLQAMDLVPADGRIKELQDMCVKLIPQLHFWMEDPASTLDWIHVQVRPVGPIPRTFKP